MGLGFTLAAASGWLAVLFLVLFFAVYIPVMKQEERELSQSFGPAFAAYRNSVSLFLPLSSPRRPTTGLADSGRKGNFQWAKVICNREYNAVVGFLLLTALIGAKMVLWR
jgi:hypothetical protein